MDINEAIEKLKVKDELAFEYVYTKTKSLVYTVIISVVKDHNQTEDLMQDTYIKMIKSINSYDNKYRFNTWLATIARNTALDYYRKQKKQYSVDIHESEYLFPLERSLQDDEISTNYILSLLDDEISTNYILSLLDDEEREVVMLYSIDEYKHKEIAIILNKPIGTITWIYNKAMKKLRKELKE